jgi:hypothetical protein
VPSPDRGRRAGEDLGAADGGGLIVDALEGSPQAIEDTLDRTEKGQLARASAAAVLPSIDDGTASKILEVPCGRGEDATGD